MNKHSAYTILHDINMITEYYAGNIIMDDIINLKKSLFNEKNFHREFDSIMDFRNANANFDKSELLKYLTFAKENIHFIGKKKIAFLTSKPNEVVLGTMFGNIKDDLPITSKLFSTLEGAVSWLNLDYASLTRIEDTLFKLSKDLHDNR